MKVIIQIGDEVESANSKSEYYISECQALENIKILVDDYNCGRIAIVDGSCSEIRDNIRTIGIVEIMEYITGQAYMGLDMDIPIEIWKEVN